MYAMANWEDTTAIIHGDIYSNWEVLDDCCVQLLIIMNCERNHSIGESDGQDSPTVRRPIVTV